MYYANSMRQKKPPTGDQTKIGDKMSIAQLDSGKQKAKKPFKRVLAVFAFLAVVYLIFCLIYVINETQSMEIGHSSTDAVAAQQTTAIPPLTQDPNIVAQLIAVGADVEMLKRDNVSVYYNNELPYRGMYTPYYINNMTDYVYSTIDIKPGIDGEKSTIAHEYLHHIWNTKMDQEFKDKLTSYVLSAYGKNSAIQQTMSTYYKSETLSPNEIFAIMCTSTPSQFITENFVTDTCNQYINRAALGL